MQAEGTGEHLQAGEPTEPDQDLEAQVPLGGEKNMEGWRIINGR